MSGNSNKYNNVHRKRGSLRTAALIVTTIILSLTVLLVISPSIRNSLASVVRPDQIETDITDNQAGAVGQSDDTSMDLPADDSLPSGDDANQSEQTEPTVTETEAYEDIEIELAATGDVLLHMPVINGVARTVEGETVYQFEPVFRYIKDIIYSADYSVLNFEGTLGGPPYTGYPMFSAPDDIVPALISTGFDLASTVNNHSIDRGFDGLIRTATVFNEQGMPNIGTKTSADAKSYRIEDIKGVKIGFSAFSFETIGTEQNRALNGIIMPKEAEPLIDSFNPYRDDVFAQDIQKILERVEAMRSEGAEFICMVMHWGEEYNISSSPYQQKLAQKLADAGVDLIIGHHPHVVQEIDFVQATNSDHEMLVYYSLGNFISNQYFDTGNASGRGQDGLAARVRITKTENDVFISSADYIPVHVVRVHADGIPSHRVVPVLAALEDPQAYETTTEMMNASLARTEAVMAANGSSEKISLTAVGK